MFVVEEENEWILSHDSYRCITNQDDIKILYCTDCGQLLLSEIKEK